MGRVKKLDGLLCLELSPARAREAATAVASAAASAAPDGTGAPTTPSSTVTSNAPGRAEAIASSSEPHRARTARTTFLVGRITPGVGEIIVVDGPTSPPFPGPWTLRAMIRPLRLLPWPGTGSVH